MSFEESLVWHASPTLASLKVANLYNFKFDSMEECISTIACFNSMMNPKGIYIKLMKISGDSYLIYVYRKSHLQKILNDEEVINFLSEYGYAGDNLNAYLELLAKRLGEGTDFPHEVGVFLGYPLPDVKAFIETKGQNCIACGDWKVYHNEQEARCLFCKFKHCKDVYVKVHSEGRRFCDMLVSA